MSKSKESKLPEISRRGFLMAALGMGLAACGKEAVATNTSPQTETPTPAPSAPETSSTPTETPTPEAPASTPETPQEVKWGSSDELRNIKRVVREFVTMSDENWASTSFVDRVPFLIAAGQAVSVVLPDNPKSAGVSFSSKESCVYYDGNGTFENATSESVLAAILYCESTALGLIKGIQELKRDVTTDTLDTPAAMRMLEASYDTTNPSCAENVEYIMSKSSNGSVPNYGEGSQRPTLISELDPYEIEHEGVTYTARRLMAEMSKGGSSVYSVIGANGVDQSNRPAFAVKVLSVDIL